MILRPEFDIGSQSHVTLTMNEIQTKSLKLSLVLKDRVFCCFLQSFFLPTEEWFLVPPLAFQELKKNRIPSSGLSK